MEKLKKDTKEWVDSLGIELTFWVLNILDYITNIELQVKFYSYWYEKDEKQLPDNWIKGYGYFVNIIVFHLIDKLIYHPGLLDLKFDFDLCDLHARGTDLSKLPDKTEIGVLVKNLVYISRKIKRAETYSELKIAFDDLVQMNRDLRKIFFSCYEASYRKTKQKIKLEEALMRKSLSSLLCLMNDKKHISYASSEIYNCGLLGNFVINDISYPIFEPYKFFDTSCWFYLLGKSEFEKNKEIFKKIMKTTCWAKYDKLGFEDFKNLECQFDWYFGQLNDKICRRTEKEEKIDEIIFKKYRRIPKELKRELITPNYELKEKDYELSEIFNYLPVKAFHDSPGAANFFDQILLGCCLHSNISKDKVVILKLIHKEEPGNSYSFGILLPSFGSFGSDYSEWILFIRCATDYSGFGGCSLAIIESCLKVFKDKIKMKTFEVDEVKLRVFVRSSVEKYMDEELKLINNVNEKLRSSTLELSLQNYLITLGCDKVKINHESKLLQKEFDVIGLKKGTENNSVFIFEAKETSHAFSDIIKRGFIPESQLIEFSKKMKIADDKIVELVKEALHININKKPILKGIYVTTMPFPLEKIDFSLTKSNIKKIIKLKKTMNFDKIEYWSKPVMTNEFRKVDVSSKIITIFKELENTKSRFLSNPKYFEEFLD